MRSIVIGFGLLITCLIALFKLAEFQFTKGNIRLEIVIAVTSVIFFAVGVYFNRKNLVFNSPLKKAELENELLSGFDGIAEEKYAIQPGNNSKDHDPEGAIAISRYGLSGREIEVLTKMGDGLSNQEIASALFLSESTIKSHVSNILFKLEAKRRTEAVKIARDSKLIP